MDRILWINKGSTHRFMGRIIKPNEKFLAHADDIPTFLRNVIRPVDPIVVPLEAHPKPIEPLLVEEPAVPTVEKKVDNTAEMSRRRVFKRTIDPTGSGISIGYSLKERTVGQFDIVDSKGKVVNEQTLTEQEARNFIKVLE